VVLETVGYVNNSGIDFIKDLGKRLAINPGDIRETAFLSQNLSTTSNASMLLPFAVLLANLTPPKELTWGNLYLCDAAKL